jgi:hypothetical protein
VRLLLLKVWTNKHIRTIDSDFYKEASQFKIQLRWRKLAIGTPLDFSKKNIPSRMATAFLVPDLSKGKWATKWALFYYLDTKQRKIELIDKFIETGQFLQ